MKQVSKSTMKAMKLLLDHYKTKTPLFSCPLCKLHCKHVEGYRHVCTTCPWILFGYKGESNPNAYACENWINNQPECDMSISMVREQPDQYDKIRRKRIGMLVQWIRNCEIV
jgi:hypothetical protein